MLRAENFMDKSHKQPSHPENTRKPNPLLSMLYRKGTILREGIPHLECPFTQGTGENEEMLERIEPSD
jgi:hypothetical protein